MMTFEKHRRSVSRAASQRLGILKKSWQEFYDRLLLERCFRSFVLNVLEYYSTVWWSAADTHLKLLDRVVSGATFKTGCVFECDLAHRRSVAVLCVPYKIRCNPMHHFYGALPVPNVPVRLHSALGLTIGTLMRPLAAEPRNTAGLIFPWQYLCGTILVTTYSVGGGAWRISRAGPCAFVLVKLLAPFLSYAVIPFSSFILWVGIVVLGSSDR